jgi:uncharacterized protein (DUF983 family)
MGYLICKECNGYYELKEGESITDFESCECGGKFTYAKSLDDINKSYGTLKKSEICPSCGKRNLKESKYCENCGQPTGNEKQESKPPKKGAGRITKAIVYFIFVLIIFLIFVYFFIPIMYSFFALLLFLIFIIGGFYCLRYGLRRI